MPDPHGLAVRPAQSDPAPKQLVMLLMDKVYPKTRRYVTKIRSCIESNTPIALACVRGYSESLQFDTALDCVDDVTVGTVYELADWVRTKEEQGTHVSVVALNQSSVLPNLALHRLLKRLERRGLIESCDKRQTRALLRSHPQLAMDYCAVNPGQPTDAHFSAIQYIVKPAFGMSSHGVKKCGSWEQALSCAQSLEDTREWLPSDVSEVLGFDKTDSRIIEPYVDGTEFSVDGWISSKGYRAIVQQKLYMVENSFIGDGMTVSPPIDSSRLPEGWSSLCAAERDIRKFAREVLAAIGFSRGVFHIEGREQHSDHALKLIEVNPRAPGGALWRSALLRLGQDLETVDARIQLGKPVPKARPPTYKYVLHYPFYADKSGVLKDWGDLASPEALNALGVSIDRAVELKQRFTDADMQEEPYLAFAVAHADTLEALLEKCHGVLKLAKPRIVPLPQEVAS
jgi:hypothetical protein